ncbi:MAG TPA: tryptophan-rich sensory protein [Chthoniobacterales bacterium]|nr:tryptophan-rich sensory protein [Chthoniobacterales bacterium]
MSTTLLALLICLAAAALEGALAGSGVRKRLASLRMPAYSPPFPVWLVIGVVYYAICFIVLRRLLTGGVTVSLVLLVLVLLANAFWSILFFRWRDLRASFIAFIPYAGLVAALVVSLAGWYRPGAVLFLCYCCYLVYAAWWGYRLWVLNDPKA